jgi:hypothetical protein
MNLTSIQSSKNIILFHVSSNINEEIKNKEKLLFVLHSKRHLDFNNN